MYGRLVIVFVGGGAGYYGGGAVGGILAGGACTLVAPVAGTVGCAAAGGSAGAAAGSTYGGMLGASIGGTIGSGHGNNGNNNDPCDKKLDKSLLKSSGIFGQEHQIKMEWMGKKAPISKYDLCGCKDGRVVIKAQGCKGNIASPTEYNWK